MPTAALTMKAHPSSAQSRPRLPTIDDDTWVIAAPFRAHVAHLMRATSLPWPVIAHQANVPLATIRTPLYGRGGRLRPKIIRSSARRLINLRAEDLTWVRVVQVSAEETGSRIRRLRAKGVNWSTLGGFLGLDVGTCQAIAQGRQQTCSAMVSILARVACELNHAWASEDGCP